LKLSRFVLFVVLALVVLPFWFALAALALFLIGEKV
jgi:hypothetical protein